MSILELSQHVGVVQYSFTSKPPSRRAFRGPFAAQGKPTKASSDDDKSIYADTHYITLSPALSPCFRGSFATTEKH